MSTTTNTLDNADIVLDDSDGTEEIQDELSGFAALLKNKYPNDATSAPPRPMIYGAVKGLSNVDQGISNELLNENADGLLVIVPVYPGMKKGDRVLLVWGGALAQSKTVDAGDVGKYLSLRVPVDKVPKGESRLRYLLNPDPHILNLSLETTTAFRSGKPGVLGDKGVNEELAFPVVELPASKVVGSAEAKAKVRVHIPPYLNKRHLDCITLFWGDQVVEHVVKVTEEVDKYTPVVIEVDESVIKAAGDSAALPVYYFVTDEVGNESEWSKDAFVTVKLQPSEPPVAPVVLDRDGNVNTSGEIDLGDLGADHVVIRVTGQFKAKDSIVLNWSGTTDAGQTIPISYGPQVLDKDSTTQTFNAPLDVLSALAGGSTRLTYTLTRDGVSTQSEAAFINIKGAPVDLPAPVLGVDKNLDYWIGVDHTYVHALVPIEAALLEEDEVILEWVGTASDGSVKTLSSKMVRVTKNRVGKVLAIRLKGSEFLKPFDGGWIDVRYRITRGKQKLKSEVARYYVGEPAETLAPPFTEPELAKNILDPALPAYEYDMQVFVPESSAQPTPCTITLYWETSEGGYYEDEQVLEEGDEVSPFLVPADNLQPKGDKPVQVWVYYRIDWEEKPARVSEDFVFWIVTADILKKMYPPLNIPSASNGKLNLGAIGASGLVLEVPHYEGMAVGDKITIKLGNATVKEHIVTALGKQEITLKPAELSKLGGLSKAVLTYEIERHPSGEKANGQSLDLTLEGKLQIYPTVEKFETITRGALRIGHPLDYPALWVTLNKGTSSIVFSNGWPPTQGGLVYVHSHAMVFFELKGLAKRVSFDIADSSRVPSSVQFYGADGKLISTVSTLAFSNAPAKGYTIYSKRFSFVTPGAAIKKFLFVDGGGDTFIDNVEYEPA